VDDAAPGDDRDTASSSSIQPTDEFQPVMIESKDVRSEVDSWSPLFLLPAAVVDAYEPHRARDGQVRGSGTVSPASQL
jgi:hypothetical protein